ncbi:MAG: recombinase family protein [Oscillospiraceae bacterium]|jgi:DNA invertase Pin-like site-specific DNA recombinase|nr:recombinase family protein [Oscillospiraceae bacterium]
MSKYIIAKYIRLSVDDGITESLSIPNQRLMLDRHIDELEIPNAEVLEFVDNGHSGSSMERPAVQELLELVRSGGVNMICVKDFSRFSRNAMDSGYFIEQVFPLYGLRFISVSDNFDSNDYKNDTGGIDVAFKFLMHEYYLKDLSLKIKSALHVKRINGEPMSGIAPYGYYIDENKRLAVNPKTAGVVRFIFKLALDGCTTAEIRDALFKNAYPTPLEYNKMERGKECSPSCRWDTQAVTRIITNEVYTGTYVSGKYERAAVGSKRAVETDPSKWVVIPDNHPAIISKEDFERVQSAAMIKGTRAVQENTAGKTAQKRIKKDGSAIGLFPLYGYIFNDMREPEINPKPAEAIRQVFQMTLDGKTVQQICEALTQAGFPTPGEQKAMDRGEEVATKKAWTRGAVKNIQSEIQYTGTAVSGRNIIAAKTADGETKPMMPRLSPQSEWRLTPNARPAIISEDVFNTAQTLLSETPAGRRSATAREFLLKGKAKCGSCGHGLKYDNGVGYPLFRCYSTVSDPGADCHRFKTVAKEIDDAVLAVIQKQAEVILTALDLNELSAKGDIKQELAEYEKRIENCNEQRQKLYERFILREITRDEYLALKNECSAEIDRLNKQVAAVKAEARAKEADKSLLKLAKQTVSDTFFRRTREKVVSISTRFQLVRREQRNPQRQKAF